MSKARDLLVVRRVRERSGRAREGQRRCYTSIDPSNTKNITAMDYRLVAAIRMIAVSYKMATQTANSKIPSLAITPAYPLLTN